MPVFHKLNQHGFHVHLIPPVLVIVAVVGIGVYIRGLDQAQTPSYSGTCTSTIISTVTKVTTARYRTCILQAQDLLDAIQVSSYKSYHTAIEAVPDTFVSGSQHYLTLNGVYSTATAYAVEHLPGNGSKNELTNNTTTGTWQILCSDANAAGLSPGGQQSNAILTLGTPVGEYNILTNATVFKDSCGSLLGGPIVLSETGQVSVDLTNNPSTLMPLCLDDSSNSASNNNPVVINPCSSTSAEQKWSGYSDNTVRINSKCLTPLSGTTKSGTSVVIATCNGTTAQEWKTGTNPSVSLNDLVNVASGLCLNVPNVTNDEVGYNAKAGSKLNILSCDNTEEQVWGWNTDGTIVPGGVTVGANCGYAGTGGMYLGFGECYWESHGIQKQPFTATGYSVNITQANPTVPVYDHTDTTSHSILEVWAGGGKPGTGTLSLGSNIGDALEFGWIKNGDGVPSHLIVTYWRNGTLECDGQTAAEAQACGFVSTSSSIQPGSDVKVGAVGAYKMVLADSQWQFWYNGTEIGYFPQSLWTNAGDTSFTSINDIDIYGEVALPFALVSKTQMGNGILGSKSGSTAFSKLSLIGSTSTTDLQYSSGNTPIVTYQDVYGRGNTTATGFTVGGPGQ